MTATVTIQPAGVLDSSHATDSIILTGWVLDQPLEPARLEKAWSVLIATWPILVARLRRDRKTLRWEYHIPTTPSVAGSFASLHIPESIHSHYAYSKPSESIRCTPKENPHHLFSPKGPSSVDELLKQDIPLTHLHVTVFSDAALIGLSVPHILCDGHGVTAISRALSAILSGGPPPPPLNHIDPYAPFAINEGQVPSPPYWRVLSKLQTIVIYARALWEWLFDNRIENRDVYFPKSEVERLKAEAMDDIYKGHGEKTDLWISSSDAILAFCLKCTHPPTSSTAPLNVFYTANLRKLLALPSPFLHNSVAMVITPTLPVSAISTLPLGQLALHIRRTLDAQTTKPAVERWLRWRLQNAHRRKVFFEPWRGQWDVVTNWRDMELMSVDFSGALPDEGAEQVGESGGSDKTNEPVAQRRKVRCVYMWGTGVQPIPLRNWLGIWANDPSGGVWVSGFLPRRIWQDKRGYGAFIEQ
ncbi:hypothetical protein AcV7_005935 [Taiwanofungus camphoratus]|nr:hypothetical protein AcV7_005935 [Antrodia cinnamomea]